jgi:CubicO group peptidase (beta-lactamase class C family)
VLDLAKFDSAMDRNQIISGDSRQIMFSPTLSNQGQPLSYGLGWFVQDHKGLRLVWHNGHQPTYSSLILKVPARDLTLILLANSDGLSGSFNLGDGDVMESPFAGLFLSQFAHGDRASS